MGWLKRLWQSGILSFCMIKPPESMRSTAAALVWMAIAAGNYMSTLLVHKFSQGADGSNWLPDDNLNKGRLEYFYWIITLLQVLNLVYYLLYAKFYTFKPLEVVHKNGQQDHELELPTHV
ncbi:putative proton-dependent oligopeptide transporter family [Helianthus annuus]|uniref:Proton-dependent oligopeptide transporter family n=1 Tax=Helianthus annuus TaxID=4232 RepID=A0A9K3I652_HELAN|nr:putative proton-dependent oligopeptide transporter family [Helianthus annuus]KAJ0533675.1 putative proton-dependent oligopeptide transporter family [Helianthus annuus]KAJ0541909.1 putative proton-dependent oligopeptide transporter family, MFS transporter superfamily [Helianthus annuus]KAJ0711004.1 putative proton-dependent oligopeptide transporter family, MFS transporter superfamily [Helianthus annuus]KAJ0887619.1 putative proton-dependent oligopeptide transporter family [Helianthus annuus]